MEALKKAIEEVEMLDGNLRALRAAKKNLSSRLEDRSKSGTEDGIALWDVTGNQKVKLRAKLFDLVIPGELLLERIELVEKKMEEGKNELESLLISLGKAVEPVISEKN